MIKLTDLNKKEFLINPNLIETIIKIPETKVTLLNGNFYLVLEEQDLIIDRIVEFNQRIYSKLFAK